MAIESITEAMTTGARQSKACEIVGIRPRTLQRWIDTGIEDRRQTIKKAPANKLSPEEREAIIKVCNSPEFSSQSPQQIVPALADRGDYLGSESSFYRILRDTGLSQRRGRAASPAAKKKPKAYVADAANQVWSWDITYLASSVKGIFFYLYLFMDIYSRKIVGWEVYENESAEQASVVLEKTRLAEALLPGHEVVLHSDNGGPMKGATMMATLDRLGVIPSTSRPAVSNDNPYSESLFKTLKYRPAYPTKPFESVDEARQWVLKFVGWYNPCHHHSGIKYVTPEQRHNGEDIVILERRKQVYEDAKKRHPERWSGEVRNWQHEAIVKLNPANENTQKSTLENAD